MDSQIYWYQLVLRIPVEQQLKSCDDFIWFDEQFHHVQEWILSAPTVNLHLPSPNVFIPTDFSIKNSPEVCYELRLIILFFISK